MASLIHCKALVSFQGPCFTPELHLKDRAEELISQIQMSKVLNSRYISKRKIKVKIKIKIKMGIRTR